MVKTGIASICLILIGGKMAFQVDIRLVGRITRKKYRIPLDIPPRSCYLIRHLPCTQGWRLETISGSSLECLYALLVGRVSRRINGVEPIARPIANSDRCSQR